MPQAPYATAQPVASIVRPPAQPSLITPQHIVKIATTEAERQRIYRFRYAIYVQEMGKQLDYADHERQILREAVDENATLLYAQDGGEVIATARIVFGKDGNVPQSYIEKFDLELFLPYELCDFAFTSRMMISPPHRTSGLRNALMRTAYGLGRSKKVRFDFIHVAPRLVRLYERTGYRAYAQPFEDPNTDTQTPLVLVLEDHEYLCAVNSLFTIEACKWPNSSETSQWWALMAEQKST